MQRKRFNSVLPSVGMSRLPEPIQEYIGRKTKRDRANDRQRLLLESYLIPYEKKIGLSPKNFPHLTYHNHRTPTSPLAQPLKAISPIPKSVQIMSQGNKRLLNDLIMAVKLGRKVDCKVRHHNKSYQILHKHRVIFDIEHQEKKNQYQYSIECLMNMDDIFGIKDIEWIRTSRPSFMCIAKGDLSKQKIWYPGFMFYLMGYDQQQLSFIPMIKFYDPPQLFENDDVLVKYEMEPFITLNQIYRDRFKFLDKFSDLEILKLFLDLIKCFRELGNKGFIPTNITNNQVAYSLADEVYRIIPRRGIIHQIDSEDSKMNPPPHVTRMLSILLLRIYSMVPQSEAVDDDLFLENQIFHLQMDNSQLNILLLQLINQKQQNRSYSYYITELEKFQFIPYNATLQPQMNTVESQLTLAIVYIRISEQNRAIDVLLELRSKYQMTQSQSNTVLGKLWRLLIDSQDSTNNLKQIALEWLQWKSQQSSLSLKNMSSYAFDLFQYGRVLRSQIDFKGAHQYFSQSIFQYENAYGKVSIEIAVVLNHLVEVLQATNSPDFQIIAEMAVKIFVKLDSIKAIFDRLEYWRSLVQYAQSRISTPSIAYIAYQNALLQFEDAASLIYQPLLQKHIFEFAKLAIQQKKPSEALKICLKGIDYQNKFLEMPSFELFSQTCSLLHDKTDLIRHLNHFMQDIQQRCLDETEKAEKLVQLADYSKSIDQKQFSFQTYSEAMNIYKNQGEQEKIQYLQEKLESCM